MVRKYIKLLKEDLEKSEAMDIARRYFVMNGFDGALTILGIIVALYIGGVENPTLVVIAGLGSGISMAVSGFVGAYLSESAERKKELHEIEDVMLESFPGSKIHRSFKTTSIFLGFVDAISPFIPVILCLTPFILAPFLPFALSIEALFLSSVVIILLILSLLGVFLAKISAEKYPKYILRMVLAGILVAILTLPLELISSK